MTLLLLLLNLPVSWWRRLSIPTIQYKTKYQQTPLQTSNKRQLAGGNQLDTYRCDRGFELWTTENKSIKKSERNSNLVRPICESDALLTRPPYLLKVVWL